MAKPAGATCNLQCSYCYYLEKDTPYMDDTVLEAYIRNYIREQPSQQVDFVWQGGEATLQGIPFYKKALQLQKQYRNGKVITNSFQTNGTLLTDDWCRFFRDNNFLVGISIDGPAELHDPYRVNKGGKATFKQVMRGLRLLLKHRVEFNTLTVVHDLNVRKPMEVYRFLKREGSEYMQFIPLVGKKEAVNPLEFGQFMSNIFDEWVKRDVGRYFVPVFDAALANEVGVPAGSCVFNDYCGQSIVIEHNGDVFACDHFVEPQYKIGNVLTGGLQEMMHSDKQQAFGLNKFRLLPAACGTCDVYKYCRGECPKNRQSDGLNYLCEGYRLFFRHIRPYMQFMANELAQQRSPANVMRYASTGFPPLN
ncbi:anaerobic sulfatase maturase [Chitinophaga sancti]|uniref:anaerobic sulfatase maturase n=1 Tax=Chitinophaga sancti TaxID=1004 RepID=UPI002A749B3A|nr:anaerobic sulfatase maturase [Chitinophaga sancti]WPQ61137.1 anaerobic sulfatase maturase [Chitinophaga sancti]